MKKLDWGDKPDIEDRTLRYFVNGMRSLWELTASKRRLLVLAALTALVVEAIGLISPILFRRIIDMVPTAVADHDTSNLWLVVAFWFGSSLATSALFFLVQGPLVQRAIIPLERAWPVQAHAKLLALSLDYHNQNATGAKISKVSKGVDKLVGILNDIYWGMLDSVFFFLLNLIVIFVLDWRLGVCMVAPVVPVAWLKLRVDRTFMPIWESWEEKKERSSSMFCGSLINVRTVQAYVRERYERRRHETLREEMEAIDLASSRRQLRWQLAVVVAMRTSVLCTIAAGVFFVVHGTSTVGTVVYVAMTGSSTLQNLQNMLNIYTRMLRNLVAAGRLRDLFLETEDVRNDPNAITPKAWKGDIRFERASFTYPDQPEAVLNEVTIDVRPGEMIALVGQSGAGKTTLVQLLCRARDVTDGSVMLDGVDVRSIDRDWFRSRFAIVHQEVEIFDGTIRDNLLCGNPDASEEEQCEALAAASLLKVVSNARIFPNGLDTRVGERGVQLSGGQQQRVGLARAYLALKRGARILILDEATNALDSITERGVQSFLDKLKNEMGITIVAIAHRLSTVQHADVILVLDEGNIVARGTHEQLLRNCPLYAELALAQQLGVMEEV